MKPIFFLIALLFYSFTFSQNIKCETIDYIKKIDDKEYSTYQYINASYSLSRSLLIIVTDNKTFMKVHLKISGLFSAKQEYTDVSLLGIKNFDKNNISDLDKKIIDAFIQKIIEYRNSNNLPAYNEDQIKSKINFIEKDSDLCKLLICSNCVT